MRTVFKYPITPNSIQGDAYPIEIDAPLGAIPVFVGMQNDRPYLWAEVDTDLRPMKQTVLICIGTGFGTVPPNAVHFQSLIQGPYVWHFYRYKLGT